MDRPQDTLAQGHARNKSLTARPSRPRSSTRGPLDMDDDPLASPQQQSAPSNTISNRLIPVRPPSQQGAGSPRVSSDRPRPSPRSPAPGGPLSASLRSPLALTKTFSHLLKPENYHPLNAAQTIPAPFRNSSKHPPADTPIPELVASGHFRAAAIAAVHVLTGTGTDVGSNGGGGGAGLLQQPAAADHARIFDLLYTRLACLTLIDATATAAQEARALEDINSALYIDEISGDHLMPWELRLLVVRLQAMGFGDPRRAVMSYYDLAREARGRIAEALAVHDHSASEVWKERLVELGVKVASALAEMDDLPGAAAQLASLRDSGDGRSAMAKALLWLQLGDSDAARRCVQQGETGAKAVAALCEMADGAYDAALAIWRELTENAADNEMVAVNLAVCLLYTGKMDEARTVLEGLVEAGFSSHTLLFNLATIYELCTDKSRALKVKLAEKMAEMEPTTRGWEKSNADFKL
ncbi:hypothetical protein BD289DRAFT_437175 [Coniella lustricola]|uniref:Tetratricopeptide repeat protein 15 n=1 Tax=Coniella lustricola TaxID=2025994 RepID=A0A2T3A494_9PEZI|nr:hypothetical protein BD289DRAFT_437175 [Coniella lustricola]